MRRVKQYFAKLGKRGELILPLFFLGGSIYFFYLATQFAIPVKFMQEVFGPDFFPEMLLGVVMIVSVKLIYDYVRRGGLSEFAKVEKPQNFWITLGFALIYIFLLEIVGFVVLTPIWVVAYMYLVGIRRWQWLVGATSILSVFVIVVFPVLMHTPMPRGVGIFRMISLLVY